MRNPILNHDETIIGRGRCADLRLFVIGGPRGYRYVALSGKTNIDTFSCFKDAADARDAMANRVREFKPRAKFHMADKQRVDHVRIGAASGSNTGWIGR